MNPKTKPITTNATNLTPMPSRKTKSHILAKTLFFLFLLATPAAARAGIVFDTPLVSAPCAAGQTTVTAEIPFRVESDTPALDILAVKTSCLCTTAEADAKRYAPGTTGKIRVTFTVGELTGFQRKTILVKTSDGKMASAFFQTTIPILLKFTPESLSWQKGQPPIEKTIHVQNMFPDVDIQILEDRVENVSSENVKLENTKLKSESIPQNLFAIKIEPIQTKNETKESSENKTKSPEDKAIAKTNETKNSQTATITETTKTSTIPPTQTAPKEYLIKITPLTTDKPLHQKLILKTTFPKDPAARFILPLSIR